MTWFEALILGIIQGITEFLPISSSGHLQIGEKLLNTELDDSLTFTIVVHGATVLSTIVVFWKDIQTLTKGIFTLKYNASTEYMLKIFISLIPLTLVGIIFKKEIKGLFEGNLLIVGCMLVLTSLLLGFTYFSKPKEKGISFKNAFIIGMAQVCAIMPGLSRSGATIATGLLLGINKEETTKFSFLMVLIPILGQNFLDLFSGELLSNSSMALSTLLIGFISAFVTGLVACKLMLKIVKNNKLIYFAIYCAIIGVFSIIVN